MNDELTLVERDEYGEFVRGLDYRFYRDIPIESQWSGGMSAMQTVRLEDGALVALATYAPGLAVSYRIRKEGE